MIEKLKNLNSAYFIICALWTVIGACLLLFSSSSAALTICIGIVIILISLMSAGLCFLHKRRNIYFFVKLTLSALFFIAGVLLWIFNKAAIDILVAALSLLIIVDASFKLCTSIKANLSFVEGWWIITAISASVIISAFTIARVAQEGARSTAIWLGITMLVEALCNIVTSFWSAKCKITEKAKIYYEVYTDIENAKK